MYLSRKPILVEERLRLNPNNLFPNSNFQDIMNHVYLKLVLYYKNYPVIGLRGGPVF